VFVFNVAPKREPPAEVVAFDVNENSVGVARLSLLATVDRVASWNGQYINPAVNSGSTSAGLQRDTMQLEAKSWMR
jgi:putative transposase